MRKLSIAPLSLPDVQDLGTNWTGRQDIMKCSYFFFLKKMIIINTDSIVDTGIHLKVTMRKYYAAFTRKTEIRCSILKTSQRHHRIYNG